ncbi:uncharacterized protein [Apostichopus japonicus]|uniref:uncharacterized protein isoform X1 n=2 Tax=Stichopus japonicus TaxID=307972 RepID=UPI003AB5E8DA
MTAIAMGYLLLIVATLLIGVFTSQGSCAYPTNPDVDTFQISGTFKCGVTRTSSLREDEIPQGSTSDYISKTNYMETSTADLQVDYDEFTCPPTQESVDVQFVFTMLGANCPTHEPTIKIYIGPKSLSSCVYGNISFPHLANLSDIEFHLPPGQGKNFTLPSNYIVPHVELLSTNGNITNTTVIVAANQEVVTYGLNSCSFPKLNQASAYRLKNVRDIGTDYRLMMYNQLERQSVVGIVAVDDETLVSLSLNFLATISSQINITLNQYESFLLPLETDFMGGRVIADKSITVLIGNERTKIPLNTGNPDPIAECLDPVTVWGRNYSLYHLFDPSLSGGYTIRILSTVHTTVMWKTDGDQWQTNLQPNEYFDTVIPANQSKPVEIFAEHDILVTEFIHFSSYASPSMVQIPSLDHPLIDKKIVFPVFDITLKVNATYYLTVFAPPGAKSSDIYLDNATSDTWTSIDGVSQTGWLIFQTTVTSGSHVLEIRGNYSINAILFANEKVRSYSYSIA